MLRLPLALAASLLIQAQMQPPTAPPPAPALVIIACKGHIERWGSDVDAANAAQTGVENWQWDYPNSKMLCERIEVPMYDPAEDAGADPLSPNFADFTQCARAGVMLQRSWDDQHRHTPWRVWRIGCPVPIINKAPDGTESIIGYKLPDGLEYSETVAFQIDNSI